MIDQIEQEKEHMLILLNDERKLQFLISIAQLLDKAAANPEEPTEAEIIQVLKEEQGIRNCKEDYYTQWAIAMLSDKEIYASARYLYLTYRLQHIRVRRDLIQNTIDQFIEAMTRDKPASKAKVAATA